MTLLPLRMERSPVARTKSTRKRHGVGLHLRPAAVLLLVPLIIGIITAFVLWSGLYQYWVGMQAAQRLETHHWDKAAHAMEAAQPSYRRKFAYYVVKPGQTIDDLVKLFGVSEESLRAKNSGSFLPGSTIKVPPIERPMTATHSTHNVATIEPEIHGDVLRVHKSWTSDDEVRTTIPELARELSAYKAFTRHGTTYRLNRPLEIDGDIRLDVTGDTVSKLELVSSPKMIAPLMFDGSMVLFDGVTVTTINPRTGQPDEDSHDGRAYVRMKNGRMDAVNSTFSWLGNGLGPSLTAQARDWQVESEGGTYGFSLRVSSSKLGVDVPTGWVQGSTFEHNYFGAFTFGTSGMMWKDNVFTNNEVYGLDPHDDSNNAMVVGNRFMFNGKHGFIVSKRCLYNVIINNTSVDNRLHGFMLHQDSAYNLIEHNVAYGNADNYVIFQSNWNTIRDNKSYLPRKAHFRISADSHHNYIVDNYAHGGTKGVYLYDNVGTTYISGNEFNEVPRPLRTKGALQTFYGRNTARSFNFDIQQGDTVIFGSNDIRKADDGVPDRGDVISGHLAD